jgi:prohibitin 1
MLFVVGLVAAALGFLMWINLSRRATAERNSQLRTQATFSGLVAVVAMLVGLSQSVAVIPAGTVGVVDLFGMVSDNTLKAGINFINPLARVIKFSIKTQELKEVMDVPSKEGLTVKVEISALFHMSPEKAAEVYKTIGEDYVGIILEPQFRSVTRGVTASFEAKALYTSEREMLAQLIQQDIEKLVEPRGFIVESTPLRSVGLPPGLTQSIEEKLRAEQESQRMQFVLTKEKQEADRKRIEAQGISDFQTIVAKGISEQLLEWKGIEATEKLAGSQNAKIVIIGSSKNGLPVILGQ